jgi:hypothetical protein
LAFILQPVSQVIPLPEQTFQGNLKHHFASASVAHQQSLFHECVYQGPTFGGELGLQRDPA